uniref:Uncharacterized protein n=1 Tax=Lates calcarifer TaxID=8187 RepID=A0A4W6F258_LATCA
MANGPVLSTASGGKVYVGSETRDSLSILDVLYANQFEGVYFDPIGFEQTEEDFYRGAPPKWLNFHISEQAKSNSTQTPLVERDGYYKLVQQIRQRSQSPGISTVKLFHQQGCGGTTLAMQVLWDLRKRFRCAVLTGSTSDITNVAKEVVHLFTAGSQGHQNTVLLLLNDEEILENLQDSIMMTMAEQEIVTQKHMPVVILLCCVRKEAVLQSDHVVLKRALSETEKQKFNEKKEELSRRYSDKYQEFHGFNIIQTNFSQAYVRQACMVFSEVRRANRPLKNQLAAFLSLLSAYVPDSYLLESQCLDFFKHDDSIHGHLSLEDRMQPFSHLIITYQQDKTSERRVRMAHPMIAQCCTELMAEAGVTRSDTARNLLTCLCRAEFPPYLLGFVKDMLTKREIKEQDPTSSTKTKEDKEWFSRLILDIQDTEDNAQSASVLKLASNKFDENPFFPQALARFYYLKLKDFNRAEMWANKAKKRDPQNSFVADTLGQVYKKHLNYLNHLRDKEVPPKPRKILQLAMKAIEAFKHEDELAENECGPDMKGEGMTKVSHVFNTSGQFGYLQVCSLLHDLLVRQNQTWRKVLTKDVSMGSVLDSLGDNKLFRFHDLINNLRDDVKEKCDFLNAFLTYSKPDMQKENQSFFREDVSSCYMKYMNHPLPDLVMEIMNKFEDEMGESVSLRDPETPEPYTVDTNFNLMQLTVKMNKFYECAYAKYFRPRYIRPLFYLGKDKAASRIIPTKLEHFLLENEDATVDLINNMMSKDKIFRDLRLQENLLKFHGVVKKYSLFTTIGGMEIKVKAHKRDSLWFPREVSFYLGFTIRGLLAFGIQTKPSENRPPKRCASCGSDMAESKTDSCKWTAATPKRTTLNHAPTYR